MSTTLPPELLQWLVRVLSSEYKNVNRTYSDVATLLQAYKTLSPKTDVYTHETGRSELLLCISGTLPVSFRGAAYNIPIALWVPHEYPSVPPVALVTPSGTIMIRPTNHVDSSGRCYHPYLAYWSQNPDKSFLIDLCSQLKDVFGKEPPAFARPPQQQQQQPPPQAPRPQENASHSAPNPPPKPSPLAGSGSHTAQQERRPTAIQHGPPPLPPLPQELSNNARSTDYQKRNSNPDPQSQRNSYPGSLSGQTSPPPPPPKPEAHGTSNQQYTTQASTYPAPSRSSYYESGYPPNQRVASIASPQAVQFYQAGPVAQSSQYQWQQQQSQSQPQQQPPIPYQQPLSAVPRVLTDPHRPRPHSIHGFPSQQQPPSDQAPMQAHSQALPKRPPPQQVPNLLDTNDNILSSPTLNKEVDNIPPPKPRNPEKDHLIQEVAKALAQRAEAAHARANQSMEQAASQREAIANTETAMERERMELKRMDDLCQKDARILQERMTMAENLIRELQNREAPNIDAVVVAPTVVHNQLYELVTDDMAIEDTIYVLGKALDRERITLDIFLKYTRTLAREQFLKRALVKKISRQIGLD